MNKPDDQILFAFFIHNKDQMYLIKQDGAFGSYYFPLGMPPDKKVFWRGEFFCPNLVRIGQTEMKVKIAI